MNELSSLYTAHAKAAERLKAVNELIVKWRTDAKELDRFAKKYRAGYDDPAHMAAKHLNECADELERCLQDRLAFAGEPI